MMNGDAVVIAKVVEQAVRTAVEVITSNDRGVWFYKTGNDIEGRHTR